MGRQGKLGAGIAALAMLASSAVAQQGVQATQQSSPQPKLAEMPCSHMFGTFDGVARDAVRCGTVTVPQDRAQPKNQKLLPVVLPVILYSPAAKGTPVVFLAGGPGESAIDAAQQVLLQTPLGQMLLRERTVVVFDRRGVPSDDGRASPDLGVIDYTPHYPRARAIAPVRDSLARVVKDLRSRGVEPKNFTTLPAVEDIADVVKALGYKKVILLGASYGTREALQFMRRHPDMVESVVLDGVAPPEATQLLDSATIATAGLEVIGRIVSDCNADPACAAEYGDLGGAVKRLAQTDSVVVLNRTANFPEAGGWRTLQVKSLSVLSVLGLASTSELIRAEAPRVLVDFANSDTLRTELSAKVLIAAAADPTLASGHRERVPVIRYVAFCGDRPQGDPFAGDRSICNTIDVPFTGPEAIKQVTSDLPALLISSGYDAQTPHGLAESAARTLSHSQWVLFPMVGHVAFARPVAMACAAIVIESFLAQSDRAPATGCIQSVVPAFTPRGVMQAPKAP
jgi:pimeloyl-ACP methyl ester carboxylesterase